MTGPQVVGLLGDAVAAVEEASAYGFSAAAAFNAAHDHLSLASRDEAVMIASVLASWIAVDLRDSPVELEGFLAAATSATRSGCG